MAKANSRTPNYFDHKTAAVIPMPRTLTLTGAQANALWEMCVLSTYSDGFTVTPEMEAACQFIADRASAAERALCTARADQRERDAIAPRRAAA
jgi:hypothetical protein